MLCPVLPRHKFAVRRFFTPLSFCFLFVLFAGGLFPLCCLKAGAAEEANRRLDIDISYEIVFPGKRDEFRLISLLPQTVEGRQILRKLTFSPEPYEIFEKDGLSYVEWRLSRDLPRALTLHIFADMSLLSYDIEHPASPARDKVDDPKRYADSERNIESGHHSIIEAARKIPNGSDAVETAHNIMRYVTSVMKNDQFHVFGEGAVAALRSKSGDCTDFTDLFVALCRAKGIPARHVSGMLTSWNTIPGHSWAEFYAPGKGWVPVDPLHIGLACAVFGKMEPGYVLLSTKRNDDELDKGMLFRWNSSRGTPVKVTASLKAVELDIP